MADEDEKRAMVRQYERIIDEVRDELDRITAELDEMEKSGAAEKHPDKHEQALKKVDEITSQLDELEDAAQRD